MYNEHIYIFCQYILKIKQFNGLIKKWNENLHNSAKIQVQKMR